MPQRADLPIRVGSEALQRGHFRGLQLAGLEQPLRKIQIAGCERRVRLNSRPEMIDRFRDAPCAREQLGEIEMCLVHLTMRLQLGAVLLHRTLVVVLRLEQHAEIVMPHLQIGFQLQRLAQMAFRRLELP